MIEALISLRRNGETEERPAGYVIAVKLTGSPWGDEELKVHQLVEWKDDELESLLEALKANGEPYPVITLPYASYNENKIINCGGIKKCNLSCLCDKNIEDPEINAGKLPWSMIGGLVGNN